MPNDRSGGHIVLYRGKEVIDGGSILDLVPDFRLDRATATLFGGDRLWRYEFPFEQTDRKLIAVEYADFGRRDPGRTPDRGEPGAGHAFRGRILCDAGIGRVGPAGHAGRDACRAGERLSGGDRSGAGAIMKLGYSTWGMPGVPIDAAAALIAGLGYDGIEIAVLPNYTTAMAKLDRAERRRIAALLAAHHLELSAISAHASLVEPDAEQHAKNMAQLYAAVDLAVDWAQDGQPPFVNTLSGGRPEDWELQRNVLIDHLGELADYAFTRGVVVGMEPHIGLLVDTPARTVDIVEAVGAPALRVNFDINHFEILGITTAESVATLIPYTVHAHVKDHRGLYPDFEWLIPGEGDFDYVTYLRTMQACGYRGFVDAEIGVMVQRRPDYDPLAAAELSYRTLAHAFERAGVSRG